MNWRDFHGGSKVSDKFAVIDRFLDIVDGLLVGGGMCFTFLVAKGIDAKKIEAEGVGGSMPIEMVRAPSGLSLVDPNVQRG